jgi:hypothetical protein
MDLPLRFLCFGADGELDRRRGKVGRAVQNDNSGSQQSRVP